MVMVSSSILSSRDDTRGTFSHAPDSQSLALVTGLVAFSKRELSRLSDGHQEDFWVGIVV